LTRTLTITVEAKLTLELGSTVILPAALRYQTALAQNVAIMKAAGVEPRTVLLEEVSAPIAELSGALATLRAAVAGQGAESAFGEAKHAQEVLLPAIDAVRAAADTLESIVADDLCRYRRTRRCCTSSELPSGDVVECGGSVRPMRTS